MSNVTKSLNLLSENGFDPGLDPTLALDVLSGYPNISHMYTIKIVRMSQSLSIIKCKALKIVREYGISRLALDVISMTSAHLKE